MDIKTFERYLKRLPEKVLPDVADIVAETATSYFKDSFRRKGFDGNPWRPGRPKSRGSLLIDTGALVNSIRPSEISTSRVVISAGNSKVTYAKVHNEGFSGGVNVPAHTRNTRRGIVEVKAHTRYMHVIKRQFLGPAKQLNEQMYKRIVRHLQDLLNENK